MIACPPNQTGTSYRPGPDRRGGLASTVSLQPPALGFRHRHQSGSAPRTIRRLARSATKTEPARSSAWPPITTSPSSSAWATRPIARCSPSPRPTAARSARLTVTVTGKIAIRRPADHPVRRAAGSGRCPGCCDQRRLRVRWVTPLGLFTASIWKWSSSASRPSQSRSPRPSTMGTTTMCR